MILFLTQSKYLLILSAIFETAGNIPIQEMHKKKNAVALFLNLECVAYK